MAIEVPINLATAAIRRIKTLPFYEEMIFEGFIGSDYTDESPPAMRKNGAWVFQGLNDEGRPFRDPEGSGRCAVVISERSDWAVPNQHNTLEFPRLQVFVYSDSTRLADGSVPIIDAVDRGKVVMGFLHRLFHRPQNDIHDWAGLQIVSSLAGSQLDVREVPTTQGNTVRLMRFYDVQYG